jgi:hypothetical protein
MKASIYRTIGSLVGALTMMVGASITADMDWTGFYELFVGKGGPVIVIGLIGVVWTAWHGGDTLTRPKALNKAMGGKL